MHWSKGGIPIILIKELQDNLENQLLLYMEFNKLAALKQDALKNNRIQELDVITAQEEQLLIKLGILDNARQSLVNDIAEEMGKSSDTMTLSELSLSHPELNNVSKELNKNINQLQDMHNTNSQLIQQALKIVNFNINLLSPSDMNTYKRPEEKESMQPKLHIVDRKV